MKLDDIVDNLRDAYKQVKPGTMLHVDELMNERRTTGRLCGGVFYTADGELYFLHGEKKTPKLAITRESNNLVLRHIDEAFEQLVNTGDYYPDLKEAEKAIAAKDTVVIDLTKLCLSGDLGLPVDPLDYRYLAVDTSKAISEYNTEEQKLLRRVFGSTDEDYSANMDMLRTQGIRETKIYVLKIKYIREKAKKSPIIGRASGLDGFDGNSGFNADVRNVDSHDRLQGVRRASEQKALEGRALKIKK